MSRVLRAWMEHPYEHFDKLDDAHLRFSSAAKKTATEAREAPRPLASRPLNAS